MDTEYLALDSRASAMGSWHVFDTEVAAGKCACVL